MTVQQSASAFRSDAHGVFDRLRSDFMDEFARLEMSIGRRLKALEIPFDARKCGFDQLVGKLERAKASSKLSKIGAADLKRLPQDCEPLQHLRASMAHGVMEIAMTDEGPLAIFRNAADVIDGSNTCYALTPDDLRRKTSEVAALTKRAREVR
jgi:hypothetical protein